MTGDRVRLPFVVALATVSVAVVLAIATWTRGSSPLLVVEDRIGELTRLAEREHVPIEALVALCWVDARRQIERSDLERSKILAREFEKSAGDVEACFDRLVSDQVDRRMTVDLMRRKAPRWHRLARR
ncbi:MAG: hypothetical protein H6832_01730 [Planctomycetes bacterium]|nr:hypothetical protein [Planctomycetota bacterium]